MGRQETNGPEETEAVGASVARRLRPGDVVLVAGELGSGKTTFVRGACRALGVSEPVTSPTFTIGQLYRVDPAGRGPGGADSAEGGAGDAEPAEDAGSDPAAADTRAREVAHLDLYRLGTLSGEDPALLADYLTPERIAFVEWPALAEPELPLEPDAEVRLAARVTIEHAGDDARAIELEDSPWP